jgi:hypothetical protein
MIIDCDRCAMREVACADCAVGVLLGASPAPAASLAGPIVAADPPRRHPLDLDTAERRAIQLLTDAGVIRPLRLTVMQNAHTDGDQTLTERPSLAG